MSDISAMESMIRRWEDSGVSLRRFGQQEGISYSRLIYWRRKLRPGREREPAPPARPGKASSELVPVKVVVDEKRSSHVPAQLTAWLPNGVAIDVPSGFDQQELERLVEVLASC